MKNFFALLFTMMIFSNLSFAEKKTNSSEDQLAKTREALELYKDKVIMLTKEIKNFEIIIKKNKKELSKQKRRIEDDAFKLKEHEKFVKSCTLRLEKKDKEIDKKNTANKSLLKSLHKNQKEKTAALLELNSLKKRFKKN